MGLICAASHRPEFPTTLDVMTFQIVANYAWALIRAQNRRGPNLPSDVNGVCRETAQAWLPWRSISEHPIGPDAVIPARNSGFRSSMTPEELKVNLKRLGLSQRIFARCISVSVGTVKKWAQGRAKIPGPAILLIQLMLSRASR
jgi:hypothetical protein